MNYSIARQLVFAGAIIFFAASAIPARAQRGGGGGGHASSSGGVHASSAGGSFSASHATSTASPHITTTNTAASSPAAHPSVGARSSSGSSLATGSARALLSATSAHASSSPAAPYFSIPRNVTIGFPPRAIPIASPRAQSAAPNDSATLSHSSAPLAHTAHMSFFGDGNEIWAEPSRPAGVRTAGVSPAPLPLPSPLPSPFVAPASSRQGLTLPLSSPSNSPFRPNIANQNQIQPRARDARLPNSQAHITIPAQPNLASSAEKPLFGNPIASPPRRPHHPVLGGNGGGRGFGFYFFDFGLGFNSWGACDPTWAFGCNSFADPNAGSYWDPNAGSYSADSSIGMDSSGDLSNGNWQEPPAPAGSSPEEIAAEKSLTVLFLNDGSVYAVTDYWVAGGKLHYASSGGEQSFDLGELDLQRTVNANAARGLDFTLRPAPAAPPTAPPDQRPPQ